MASLPQQRIKLLPRGEFGAVQVGLALNVAGQPRMEARIGTRHYLRLLHDTLLCYILYTAVCKMEARIGTRH